MKLHERSEGEQWSSQYHNPTWAADRDRSDSELLVRDLRRVMWVGVIGVTIFAIMLMVNGSAGAGVSFLMIVGTPLLIFALTAEALRVWWRHRNSQSHT